ncbi:MAG: ATP synthase F1 subunit epsilon [Candidatus Magasanikbacteria bacterium]|nr:ATP synthase F1 subunit epsilon [Candidatus Magasanikbacteria bacterium]
MLLLKIVTPDGITYESEIDQVSVSTQNGEITVLQNHIPLISVLKAGEIRILKSGHEVDLAVSSGVLEVRPHNEVYILADTAERAEHIDLERAESARKRAEELMAQKQTLEDVEFALLQAKLEKELARLKVGKKYKNIR